MRYLVGYQLHTRATPRDYEQIDATLRLLEGVMLFQGQWIVRAAFEAEDLLEYLQSVIYPDDRLVVCEIAGELKGGNVLGEPKMLQPEGLQHP